MEGRGGAWRDKKALIFVEELADQRFDGVFLKGYYFTKSIGKDRWGRIWLTDDSRNSGE